MGLCVQVEITLVLLRQNMSQTVVADLFGNCRSSSWRTSCRILGLLDAGRHVHRNQPGATWSRSFELAPPGRDATITT